MKRRVLLVAVCLMMILSTVIAPISACAKTLYIMKVNVDGARMRTGPGDYPWTKSLKKGTKVLLTGKKTKAFYYVHTASGAGGWVFRDFLSSYGAVDSNSLYRARSKATVYKKPRTSSSRVTKVSSGYYVFVYATRGGWAYVKTTSGKSGYMKLSSLRKA